jgi:hypothetical protein
MFRVKSDALPAHGLLCRKGRQSLKERLRFEEIEKNTHGKEICWF